ncbi:hypothetical protein BC939DRAFT_393801 [Gamsiella multidivaricata]|uniref:uncharacterized protein n=1 Tax=Gamsiella multidivaricata TaxID=101098 RepID=UPI00221FF3D5|nr:uncharacterized protein BC939DRAFT_393801 [Gamsiella multidivaricata]KAI7828881.1 hypothetical protein BC939DRAFT_393801 [Gamsiella multidivaricata]
MPGSVVGAGSVAPAPVITAGGASAAGGPGIGAKSSSLSALQEIEEAYNKRLDMDVAQLMESFGDIVKVASGRATNIVSSAESLLAMVTELKQTLLLNDANTLSELSTRRQNELSTQKTAVKQRVLGLKEEVDRTIWELEQACYGTPQHTVL